MSGLQGTLIDAPKQEGPPSFKEDGPALSFCGRRLRGEILRQKDPVRGFRRPQVMTMRHWITSFQKLLQDECSAVP